MAGTAGEGAGAGARMVGGGVEGEAEVEADAEGSPGTGQPPGLIVETGIDIVEIDRVADLARRYGERFARRVFGPEEWAEFHARPHSLAARFAAKEAVIKALDAPDLPLHAIRVERAPGGRPRIRLVGPARARADALGVLRLSLSLSHGREYAVAMVVAVLERAAEPSAPSARSSPAHPDGHAARGEAAPGGTEPDGAEPGAADGPNALSIRPP